MERAKFEGYRRLCCCVRRPSILHPLNLPPPPPSRSLPHIRRHATHELHQPRVESCFKISISISPSHTHTHTQCCHLVSCWPRSELQGGIHFGWCGGTSVNPFADVAVLSLKLLNVFTALKLKTKKESQFGKKRRTRSLVASYLVVMSSRLTIFGDCPER